jgi:hypothetical protein
LTCWNDGTFTMVDTEGNEFFLTELLASEENNRPAAVAIDGSRHQGFGPILCREDARQLGLVLLKYAETGDIWTS